MFVRLFVLRTTSLRLNELMKQEVFLAVPMDEREKFIAVYRVDDLVGTLPSPQASLLPVQPMPFGSRGPIECSSRIRLRNALTE